MKNLTYKITEIPKFLETARMTGDSVLLIGKHGIGKTEIVTQWAEEQGYYIETLYLSAMDPGDMMGLMREDGKGGHRYTVPGWLQRMRAQNKPCVLFLDEFNRAHRDIRQASYPLMLSKRIHDHELPKNTLVIAAINPDDPDYDVDSFDLALMGRFKVFRVDVDVPAWISWVKEQKDCHESVARYIAKNPGALTARSDGEDGEGNPRSWTRLARTVLACEKIGAKDQIMLEAAACVGRTNAGPFYTFYKDVLKPFGVDDYLELLYPKGKKPKKVDYALIEKTAEEMTNHFDDLQVNAVQLGMLHKSLATRYLDTEKTYHKKGYIDLEAALTDNFPYMVFLYAIPVELRASCIRELKDIDQKKFDLIFAHNAPEGMEKFNNKKLATSIVRFKASQPQEEAEKVEESES